ncbi:MAG: hypothetical protein NC215_00280 [Ruminococcus sp.]|nr:hypothetical protein [Ruminococcus sp.]
MPKPKNTTSTGTTRKRRPAMTPEARENQMIALAIDLAEQQLMDGTASSQVITHFLKLGTTREKLEKEILEKQKELVTAKTKSIQSEDELKALYKDAVKAMSSYRSQSDEED